MTDSATGTYETKTEGQESPGAFVKQWLDALRQAETEEKDWIKEGEEAWEVFRGKKKSKGRNFNILHSNVETLCPAIYNSTPAPDVRRRFADPDPVAKVVADILERGLTFSLDAYDFDAVMKAVIRDGEVPGRGVPRVRYVPTLRPVLDPKGQPVVDPQTGQPQEEVVAEEVISEYVPWKFFRRGPARTWADVPWVAFGDLLSREQLRKLCGEAIDKNGKVIAEEVRLNYTADQNAKARKAGTPEPTIFARALVWQIWDKDSRKVISICPDYDEAPLATVDDPLGLMGFFPVPRPYQPILATDSLVPIVPYEVYRDLVLELNDVTARIAKLVKQLRPRGLYAGNATDMVAVSGAEDGELVAATDIEKFLNNGGLEKAISWFPLDATVNALRVLVEQRSEIKQVIYEVTGIADILRGSTNPNETLGAQQIKAQWGSLRIQDRQSEVQRMARDLLRLKAEIIAGKFSWETLSAMTGIDAPTMEQKQAAQAQIAQAEQAKVQARQMAQMQAQQGGPAQPGMVSPGAGIPGAPPMPPAAPPVPQPPPAGPDHDELPDGLEEIASQPSREEVLQVLRSDITRRYRVDIESDSTIRGDLTRNQQTMNIFLQGTAQFAQAMGPIIQLDKSMLSPALEVYAAFARQFKLGKQAEDAIDSLSEKARQVGSAPTPQPPPDPKLELAKFQADAGIKQTNLDMEFATKKHAMDMQRLDREELRDQQKLDMERQRASLAPPPAPVVAAAPAIPGIS